jgi:hypothetical protein
MIIQGMPTTVEGEQTANGHMEHEGGPAVLIKSDLELTTAATEAEAEAVEGFWEESNRKNVKKNRLVYAALSFLVGRLKCNGIKMPKNNSVVTTDEWRNTGK